jgi:nicotinate phosphoribosyltransferase
MTVFDQLRLTNTTFNLSFDRLRQGYYSDRYFANVVEIMKGLAASGYGFAGQTPRQAPVDPTGLAVADLVVEAQVFNRRQPYALIAGVDVALAVIRHTAGHYEGDEFVETWPELEVVAVEDGAVTHYDGNPENIQPVIKIRGRYSEFTLLETLILGYLTRASRVATNVFEVLKASNNKPVLFMPARYDLPEAQELDGYAYWLAVQRHNYDFNTGIRPLVSTDAQAAWWGGRGAGTVPHALIACFFADTAEAMLAFARYIPIDVPRIALVDFNNDSVGAALATLNVFWPRYRAALEAGDEAEQKRYTLNAVRLDTSSNMLDAALSEGDPRGISPLLVRSVRRALDNAWTAWDVPAQLEHTAREYCRSVQIVVSGGFDRDKIARFEAEDTPVDIYGAGSTFFTNDRESSADFTMDVVRVKLNGHWVDMPKLGRRPCDNPDLRPVDLAEL